MLADLSLVEGDPDRAREILSKIFVVRTPMGNIYADHLARRLGILDQHLERKLAPFGWTPDQRTTHTANQMTALRAEMSRCGWK